MEEIKFKTWADHWHNGVFYPKGSELVLTKAQYEWLCDATGVERETPTDWEDKITKEFSLDKKAKGRK